METKWSYMSQQVADKNGWNFCMGHGGTGSASIHWISWNNLFRECSNPNASVRITNIELPWCNLKLASYQGGAMRPKKSRFLLHTPMFLVSHLVSQTSKALYYMWHTGVSSCCILGFPGVTSGLFPSATCDTNVTPGVTPRHWSMQQKATAFWPHGATYFVS